VADTANAASWSVQSNLQSGDVLFGDRSFLLTTVPAALPEAGTPSTSASTKRP
jgi:large repetitive protein